MREPTLFEKIMGAIIYIVVFMIGCTIFGSLVPFLYYQYIDDSDIFYIEPEPLLIENREQPFHPCNVIVYKGTRYSKINFTTDSSVDLIRTENNAKSTYIFTSENSLTNIHKGDTDLELEFLLPCNLKDGKYYLSGIIQYRIWGAQRSYVWTSQEFNIVNKLNE